MVLYQIQVLKFKPKHYFTAFCIKNFPYRSQEKNAQILIVTTEQHGSGYKIIFSKGENP